MRKHNAFSGVGGGLRRGVYKIRNIDWWRSLNLHTCWMLRNCVFIVIAHMLDATQLCLEGICFRVNVRPNLLEAVGKSAQKANNAWRWWQQQQQQQQQLIQRLLLQVVPGQAGGGSFRRKKNYIAKKEFAYRMCARRPTSAMPKPFLCCEGAFCCSSVVMWPVLMSWSCLRGEMQ